MNLGNLLYVLVALAGGIFLALGVPNLSISGMTLSIAVVVPFLNLSLIHILVELQGLNPAHITQHGSNCLDRRNHA